MEENKLFFLKINDITRFLLRSFSAVFNMIACFIPFLCLLLGFSQFVLAAPDRLAPNFSVLPKGSTIVIMPTDIELFSISAGGVAEPRADWTEAALKHFKTALLEKEKKEGLSPIELSNDDIDAFNEVNFLHAAVAQSIAIHHFGAPVFHLPTKEGKLDWSLGDSVLTIQQKTGADYALFSWIRDSYTSSERAVAMVALALVGVGIGGGVQTGYASLVDLKTGQVLWFNSLSRVRGDLRQADKAKETVDALLEKFPVAP